MYMFQVSIDIQSTTYVADKHIYIYIIHIIYIYILSVQNNAVRVFFGFSICSEASMEKVKKALRLAVGTRKDYVRKTLRNRTFQVVTKR